MEDDFTPEHVEVSAKQSSPGVWRITRNGRILGDSRGFDFAHIRSAIDEEVATLRGYKFPYDAVAVYPEEVR